MPILAQEVYSRRTYDEINRAQGDTAPLKISHLFEPKSRVKYSAHLYPHKPLIRKSAGIYNLDSNLTSLISY